MRYFYMEHDWDNSRMEELDAKSWDEVPQAWAKKYWKVGYKEVQILEVNDIRDVDVGSATEAIKKQHEAAIISAKREKDEKKEKALYETLKLKYEKNK